MLLIVNGYTFIPREQHTAVVELSEICFFLKLYLAFNIKIITDKQIIKRGK